MRGIGRDIAGVLVLKLFALAALYFVFFSDATEPSAHDVASHVLKD